MAQEIVIKASNVVVEAELNDSHTAKAIAKAMPIQAKAQRWGGEIYFSIPVSCELQADSREVMEAGELGYWPPGKAFCIFFGPTPASQANEIRAASAVNIVGKMKRAWSGLWDVQDGSDVCVERKT